MSRQVEVASWPGDWHVCIRAVYRACGLALAVAHPFLPGSQSDVFRGVSVRFGPMITQGSTGEVMQPMSGLVVVYSRSLRKGDFVAVNNVEGMVSEVRALALKISTMRNEKITLPNTVITRSPNHNHSKLGTGQGTLVSTKVTIGCDTPWRQVHAMLQAAALATVSVRSTPVPFVYQRALADFYVEYELFAHIDRPLERVPMLSALHAAMQDEFNTRAVQIMPPHDDDQPPQALRCRATAGTPRRPRRLWGRQAQRAESIRQRCALKGSASAAR